ncbi:MAG: aminotransferase class I/II-fold pyridoxal phosphate-dependent enzyme [Gemmatimonadales bacterium]
MTVRVRPAVLALPPYRGLPAGRPAVRLDGNESPFGPVARARYPDTEPLRVAWARYLTVPRGALLVTAGSGPALALIAELVLDVGDAAVMLAPSFELYGLAARRRGARCIAVPTRPGARFPLVGVRRALSDDAVRLCLLGVPDNPTGVSPSQEQLRDLARAFPNILFVVDEAYGEFAGVSALRLARTAPNVLVLRTMSKAWGLAGLRVGAVVGPTRLIRLLARLNVPYPVTSVAASAACEVLGDDRAMRATVRHVRREQPRLVRALRRTGLTVRATAANFVLVDRGTAPRAAAFVAALDLAGIAVRDRSHLPGMAGTVRISVGTVADHVALQEALRLLLAPFPQALLFDMDGTLVDVSRSYDEIIWRLVQTFADGKAGSRDEVLAIKHRPDANDDVDAVMLALAERRVDVDRAEVSGAFQALYGGPRGLHRRDRWFLTVNDLRQLARRQPLAVVTGRPRHDLSLAFRRMPARQCFRALVSSDDTRRPKPDAAPVRMALRLLGVRTGWMIGDSPADLLAARAAGVPAIGIATGPRAALLRGYHPMAVLDSATRLTAIMRGRDLLAAAEEES